MRLPSVSDTDPVFASDDKTYVFENPDDLPVESLINEILPIDQELSARSTKVPATAEPGFSEIYRNAAFPNGLKSCITADLDTHPKIFDSAVERHGHSPCLLYHEYDYENDQHMERYVSIDYNTVSKRVTNLASGLFFLLNSCPFKDPTLESHQKIDNHQRDYASYNKDNFSFVATFYASNRAEWILSDLACSAHSITSTALYDTLGAEASKYILETTESPVVIASRGKIEHLISLKKENPEALKSLILVISMDPLTKKHAHLIREAEAQRIKVFDFSQVEQVGAIFPSPRFPPTPDSVYTITFTSGTTGAHPKGVILPQRSVTCALSAAALLLPHSKKDREFCFLPLAHIFERHMSGNVFLYGGSIAFPRLGGNTVTMVDDLKLAKPTFLANVPRIFGKIEATIKAMTIDSESKFSRTVYLQAFDAKRQKQESENSKGDHFIYDQTVIKRLRKAFGFDNMEMCFTGSAPIAAETIRFLKSSLGIGITQGYGSSESFAGIIMALPNHADSVGTCGAIAPTVEARLREVPEMGYNLTDEGGPRGELQLRGPQMFTHYYKNEEETKKAIDKDGWFSTGDVAQITHDGWFIVIDRVKNFFKLAQGEYVTPEKIENLYLSSNSFITQVFAHGNSLNSYLVGIVGIDPVNIVPLVKKMGYTGDLSSPAKVVEACNKREIKTQILLTMNTNVNGKLNGFEKLHNIFIDIEPLRLEREVITPTSKLRRPIAAKFFKEQIDAMYSEGSILKDLKL